jgi:hypothetical protein
MQFLMAPEIIYGTMLLMGILICWYVSLTQQPVADEDPDRPATYGKILEQQANAMVLHSEERSRVTRLEEEIADLRKALEDFVVELDRK